MKGRFFIWGLLVSMAGSPFVLGEPSLDEKMKAALDSEKAEPPPQWTAKILWSREEGERMASLKPDPRQELPVQVKPVGKRFIPMVRVEGTFDRPNASLYWNEKRLIHAGTGRRHFAFWVPLPDPVNWVALEAVGPKGEDTERQYFVICTTPTPTPSADDLLRLNRCDYRRVFLDEAKSTKMTSAPE